jgi:microcystin-dependent protein
MPIKDIAYGSLASSSEINENFHYLEDEISKLSELISTKSAGFASNVATLNSSVSDLLDYKSAFFQTGMIIPISTSVIPLGFLLCDGSELNIADYPELYSVIGTTFGSSDSTKFCLPDFRDKTFWGAGVSQLGQELTSKLPNIKGQFRLVGTEGSSAVNGAFSAGSKGGSYGKGHDASASNPLMKFDASTYSDVYSDDVSIVQPPAIALNFVIKY